MSGYTNQGPDGFAVVEVKCPSCGGPLQVREGATSLVCQFCDSTFHVSYKQKEPVDTGIEPDGTIRDKSTGQGLFRAVCADGLSLHSTELKAGSHSSRPYIPTAVLVDGNDGVLTVYAGNAGQRLGGAIKGMMTMYGGNLAGVDHTNYADVPNPIAFADQYAEVKSQQPAVQNMRFARQVPCKNLNELHQQTTRYYEQVIRGQGGTFGGAMTACVLRVYEYMENGVPSKTAIYLRLIAAKFGLPATMGMPGLPGLDMSGLGEAFGGIADKIGSLFGGGKKSAPPAQSPYGGAGGGQFPQPYGGAGQPGQYQQPYGMPGGYYQQPYAGQAGQPGLPGQFQQPYGTTGNQFPKQPYAGQPGQYQQMPGAQMQQMQQAPAGQPAMGGVQWCIPDYQEFIRSGSIMWGMEQVVLYSATAARFDERFERMFVPFTETVDFHADVMRLAAQAEQREAAQIQNRTSQVIAQQQAAFEAQQQAMRERQAAFDSYIDSVQAASDRHHQDFRRRSNEMFDGGSYGSGGSGDFSEAIRGVNTFVTSDGREVELSVSSDVAYENQAGDVIGGPSHFDPGADWTQINRK